MIDVDVEDVDVEKEEDYEPVMRQCTRCDRLLVMTEDFHKNRKGRDGYYTYCKECAKESAAAWKEANPEQVRESAAAWRKANPEYSAAWYKTNSERHRASRVARYKVNPERERERDAAWQKAHPEEKRAAHLLRTYGISVEAWNDMLQRQDNRCALCGEPFDEAKGNKDKHTDHDHTTGTIRGILHSICNTALGHYEKDKSKHEMFETYLKGKTA